MKVLAFGEVLWDIIEDKEYLGGAPLNFAAHFVKCGGASAIISAVGRDERGRVAIEETRKLGVDCSFIKEDPAHATGTVLVTLTNGQPDYVINTDVAYDYIPYVEAYSDLGKEFDTFYFGSLIQRNAASARTLRTIIANNKFRHIFYDVNLRKRCYDQDIIRKSVAVCSILKLNAEEVKVISTMLFNSELQPESFCRPVARDYPNISVIIITAAEKGCFLFTSDRLVHIPAAGVEVVDAVGAGDAFSAAFLTQILKGADPVVAARVANEVGTFVVGQRGPIPEYSVDLKRKLTTEN